MTTAEAVAVLGLGAMGLPMAANLAGRFPVRGFDVVAERRALAERAGVAPTGTAAEAVAGADVVLIAVRDQAQLEQLLFGETGIAPRMRRGAVVLLTSTVGVAGVRAVAPRLAEAGLGLVDAPVSGGPARAGDGDLLVVSAPTTTPGRQPRPSWRSWPQLLCAWVMRPATARP